MFYLETYKKFDYYELDVIFTSISTENFFWTKMQLSLLRNTDISSLSQTPKLWDRKKVIGKISKKN